MTGKTINEKIEKIRSEMANKGANVLVVTALDEIACKSTLFYQILSNFCSGGTTNFHKFYLWNTRIKVKSIVFREHPLEIMKNKSNYF